MFTFYYIVFPTPTGKNKMNLFQGPPPAPKTPRCRYGQVFAPPYPYCDTGYH